MARRRPAHCRPTPQRRFRWQAWRGALAVALMAVTLVAVADQVGATTIATPGPLTNITTSPDLNCSVNHLGDSTGSWFANTACGTFVATGGTIYGPQSVPAGLSPTPVTPVSQSPVTGAGTAASPYTVVTVVDVGATGLRLTQTDTYVTGRETYQTQVRLANSGAAAVPAIVYRAGDCYLQDSDAGLGDVQGAAVSCKALANSTDPERIEQLLPLTGGSHYYEAGYSQVWARISSQQPFDDTCRCTEAIDNGAGLSWNVTVPAGGTAAVAHLTGFSPTGAQPVTVTKTADAPSLSSGQTSGYNITITNPGAVPATLDSITDTLPAGFSYVPGSSSNATVNDPSTGGSTLSWAGPFFVPAADDIASGTLSVHFGVTVFAASGTYTNSASASGTGVTVIGADNVAPVTVSADAPVAVDDNYTVTEDDSLQVPASGVLGNDSASDGGAITAALQSGPAHGTLTLAADGSFSYVPAPDYFGPDSFRYRAVDASGATAEATVSITVDPVPDAPQALDDAYTVAQDTPLRVPAPGVLGNDVDPDGDTLNVAVVTGADQGTVTVDGDGALTFAPAAGFVGTDSFTYQASDGQTVSNSATVTIQVSQSDRAPSASDDAYSLDQDTTLTVPPTGILANDTDPDGDTLTASGGAAPGNGTVALDTNGGFTYTPNGGFSGTDSFTYQANDGTALSTPATVTLTVRLVPPPPPPTEPPPTEPPPTEPPPTEPPPTEPPGQTPQGPGTNPGTPPDGSTGAPSGAGTFTSKDAVAPAPTTSGESSPEAPATGDQAAPDTGLTDSSAPFDSTAPLDSTTEPPVDVLGSDLAAPTGIDGSLPGSVGGLPLLGLLADVATGADVLPLINGPVRVVRFDRAPGKVTLTAVTRGDPVGLAGQLDGPCADLQTRVGDRTVGTSSTNGDGGFAVDVNTLNLRLGEQTATLRCGDDGQSLGQVQFIVSQPVDSSGGPSDAGLLVCVLIFFMLSMLLAVSVPLPRPDNR